jgi:hypothetical protein
VAGGFTNWKSIAVGTVHVCGILTTGAGYCWGSNNSGKLGINTDTDASAPVALVTAQSFTQIEVGYMHTCGVTTTSALYCWGANVSGESGSASDVGQVSMAPVLAAGGEWSEVNLGGSAAHTCMITRDRLSVRCMGRNDKGQLGNNTTAGVNVPHAAPVLVVGQQPLP